MAAAYVERIVGINIWKKIRISESPSILAASMMSCGNDRALCRYIMIRNGVEIVGRINHQ